MGLYEWRFRISLAGSQAVSSTPAPYERPFRAHGHAAAAWLSTFARPSQASGRLYSLVRTYCF
jgi:hypothetical protein